MTDIKSYDNYNKIEVIDKKLVGSNLKEFRKENKITLVKLVEILNTSHSTLSAYEHGENFNTYFVYIYYL